MGKRFFIYGDSAFAERIYSYIRIEGEHTVLGFTNDEHFITRSEIQGLPVIPFSEFVSDLKNDCELILAYGYTKMNNLREKVYNECIQEGCHMGVFISSRAHVYTDNIGEGTIILPNAVIGPGCQIGKGNHIASSVVLSHDNTIGDFNYLSANVVLGGYASVNNHCFLGLHSTVKDNIVLADYTLLGSGCNMLKTSIVPGGVYVGNPARLLEKNSTDITI